MKKHTQYMANQKLITVDKAHRKDGRREQFKNLHEENQAKKENQKQLKGQFHQTYKIDIINWKREVQDEE